MFYAIPLDSRPTWRNPPWMTVLLILIILPLCIPALIFGAGAVSAAEAGISTRGHFSLLGALLIASVLLAPLATGAALRIATE